MKGETDMVRKLIVAGIFVAALAGPTLVRAHEGHAHKLMGTVSSVDGDHISVKTTDGKTVMVMVDAKTKITQGKTKLTAAALKVGDRIVAQGAQGKDMLTAASVQVGTAPDAGAKK
jgi:hypothetical protein